MQGSNRAFTRAASAIRMQCMAIGVGNDAVGCDPSREGAIALNIIDYIERAQ